MYEFYEGTPRRIGGDFLQAITEILAVSLNNTEADRKDFGDCLQKVSAELNKTLTAIEKADQEFADLSSKGEKAANTIVDLRNHVTKLQAELDDGYKYLEAENEGLRDKVLDLQHRETQMLRMNEKLLDMTDRKEKR